MSNMLCHKNILTRILGTRKPCCQFLSVTFRHNPVTSRVKLCSSELHDSAKDVLFLPNTKTLVKIQHDGIGWHRSEPKLTLSYILI